MKLMILFRLKTKTEIDQLTLDHLCMQNGTEKLRPELRWTLMDLLFYSSKTEFGKPTIP